MKRHTHIYFLLLLLLVCGACRRGTLTRQQANDAANAVRQLDRVRVAVSVKAPRNEYDLVLDTARRAVTEKLGSVPDGPLRQEIAAALDTYENAQKLWAQQDSAMPENAAQASSEEARARLWRAAEEHLNKAKELLTQENRIF